VGVRGQDADRGEETGIDVGDRIAGFHRRTARFAGDGHQAGEALRDQIEAAAVAERSIETISRHRAVDEPGVDLRQHVVAQAQLLQRASAVVLGQHVRVTNQAHQHFAALFMLQVDRDSALVPVHHEERRGHAVDPRLAVSARVVAAGKLFDLDHVGAHVGQHHPARGSCHDLRELEHVHPGQRTCGMMCPHACGCRRCAAPRGGAIRALGRPGGAHRFGQLCG
jgi:hypothetical protein